VNINIDIYSDTICPWCYIGFNKLKDSIKEFSKNDFNLIWRPFQLNPDMPLNGMERQKYLEAKFNGKKNAVNVYKKIKDVGLINNIYFQFDKIFITPNSFASHKLLALAYKLKVQNKVVETLFYDYFIEGINIGNIKELIRISKLHNIFNENTFDYLQSDQDNENLLAEEAQARQLGIKGVPCFIINKQFVLYGAQDKKIFIDIFNRILNDN
jgi:predicted DsbA family dithiol-disulfide isomerase